MKLTSITLPFLLALSFAFSAAAAETPTTTTGAPDTNVVVNSRVVTPAPAGVSLGSTEDQKRYAAREVASPNAKNFKGGDVIVIGASALVVILLVVVIIILI
jgi:hypothetical protein